MLNLEWLVKNLGYIGILIGSAGAATVIPFSSEAILAYAIVKNLNVVLVIVVATVGNCVGITFNYLLGRISHPLIFRFFNKRQVEKARDRIERYGLVALFLSWVPVIGDPITLAAGLVNIKFREFALIAFTARLLRYVVIALFLTKLI